MMTIASMYDPVFPSAPNQANPGAPIRISKSEISSFGVADTMSIANGRAQLTVGIRRQEIDATNYNSTTGAVSSVYNGKAWTPAFGLLVKPWENVSLYANYIEGLQSGTTVGVSYANAGETFAPYVSEQYEAGVKVDWGSVTTTLAVFQISQPKTVTIADASGGLPTLALDGEQRSRGIELSAYGEVVDGARLLAGITLLDARQTKTTNGAFDGDRASGAPGFRAVIGGEWDTPFIPRLTLSGRFTYTSDQVASNARPSLKIPSWTQVDLSARYALSSPLTESPINIRFNVDNVFNSSFWKGSYSSGILYRSEPRTFRLSATLNF